MKTSFTYHAFKKARDRLSLTLFEIANILNYDLAVDIGVESGTKIRKGKTVTTVSGFQINAGELKNLATQLKRRCGTGGSVKDGVIIIQGDHKDTLIIELKNRGFKAKIVGG